MGISQIMPLSLTQEAVLNSISRRVPSDGTWCIFGSTDSVLRGLDDDPSDIDILATEEVAKQFRKRFSDGFVGTREVGQSQIDEYEMIGEEVEVIFSCSEKDHQKPLLDIDTLDLEVTADREIPMLPLPALIRAYRQIGKHGTADRLESHLG